MDGDSRRNTTAVKMEEEFVSRSTIHYAQARMNRAFGRHSNATVSERHKSQEMMMAAKVIADVPSTQPWMSWLPTRKAEDINWLSRVAGQNHHYYAKLPVRLQLHVDS
jgi:hypothetical protein